MAHGSDFLVLQPSHSSAGVSSAGSKFGLGAFADARFVQEAAETAAQAATKARHIEKCVSRALVFQL